MLSLVLVPDSNCSCISPFCSELSNLSYSKEWNINPIFSRIWRSICEKEICCRNSCNSIFPSKKVTRSRNFFACFSKILWWLPSLNWHLWITQKLEIPQFLSIRIHRHLSRRYLLENFVMLFLNFCPNMVPLFNPITIIHCFPKNPILPSPLDPHLLINLSAFSNWAFIQKSCLIKNDKKILVAFRWYQYCRIKESTNLNRNHNACKYRIAENRVPKLHSKPVFPLSYRDLSNKILISRVWNINTTNPSQYVYDKHHSIQVTPNRKIATTYIIRLPPRTVCEFFLIDSLSLTINGFHVTYLR